MDESCCRHSAQIYKLKNGDALLSLLNGVGTGIYVNKLFLLHLNDHGILKAYEFKSRDLFQQAYKKIKLESDAKSGNVIIKDKNQKNHIIKFSSEDISFNSTYPVLSADQLKYKFGEIPRIFFVVALITTENDCENFLGEISFDLKYHFKNEKISFYLSNLQKVQ